MRTSIYRGGHFVVAILWGGPGAVLWLWAQNRWRLGHRGGGLLAMAILPTFLLFGLVIWLTAHVYIAVYVELAVACIAFLGAERDHREERKRHPPLPGTSVANLCSVFLAARLALLFGVLLLLE